MSDFKPRRCRECGDGVIRPLAKEGRRVPYRDATALLVPATIEIPTCDHCGSEWIDHQTAVALDEALQPLYEQETPLPPEEMASDNVEVDPAYLDPDFGLAPITSEEWLKKMKDGDSY